MRFQTLVNETKAEVKNTIKYIRRGENLAPEIGPDYGNEWTHDFIGEHSNYTYKYTHSGSLLSYAQTGGYILYFQNDTRQALALLR